MDSGLTAGLPFARLILIRVDIICLVVSQCCRSTRTKYPRYIESYSAQVNSQNSQGFSPNSPRAKSITSGKSNSLFSPLLVVSDFAHLRLGMFEPLLA